MKTKICKKCGKEKELTEFRKKKGNSDGRTGKCNQCLTEEDQRRLCKKTENPEEAYKAYCKRKQIQEGNKELTKQGKYQCSVCKKIKDISEFYKSQNKLGHNSQCKDCTKLKYGRKPELIIDGKQVCRECGKFKVLSKFRQRDSICLDCAYPKKKEKLDMIKEGYLICATCKGKKPLADFTKSKNGLGGYTIYCRICAKKHRNKSYEKLFPKKRETLIKQKEEKEQLFEQGLKRCSKCKEIKVMSSFCTSSNSFGGLRASCKQCSNLVAKKWKEKNPEKIKAQQKRYKEEGRVKPMRRSYSLERKKKDPDYKMRVYLSNHLYLSLKKADTNKMGKSCMDYFPYSPNDLRLSLESQFDKNMNWENHGTYWQIDHTIPCSLYNFANKDGTPNVEEIQKCYDLKNLSPMEKNENDIKNNKLSWNLIEEKNIYHLLPINIAIPDSRKVVSY